MTRDLEQAATVPVLLHMSGFNANATIPYGCTIQTIQQSMQSFLEFLGYINQHLHIKGMIRLESLLMPANFSSIVGEYIITSIPQFCPTLVKNGWHNGHPDLLPTGVYPQNAAQHVADGIEIKASRYLKGWQGHNAESCWLMVFVFDSNKPADVSKGIAPRPFRFIKVVGAPLEISDWHFSGRSATSRRTITATITQTGCSKMEQNWIYRDPVYQTADDKAPGEEPDETEEDTS
jgi:hypothetical protein